MLNLIGFGVGGDLGIFSLFNILHHLSYEGMAVVLILCHNDLQNEPQSPEKEGTRTPFYSAAFSFSVLQRRPEHSLDTAGIL